MKSLKLNQIEKNVLSANEMNQVNGGGGYCGCGCAGSSSTDDNGWANAAGNKHSPGVDNALYCIMDEIVVCP